MRVIPKSLAGRLLLLLALVVLLLGAWQRFTLGLGATTGLSDAFPWGLWIGFDVLIGVATAAGGFTLAFLVYILDIREFRHVARAAVLTALLGYSFVGVALLFDLGQPLRLWHPSIFWNPHSVMFEVAWCVMLYSSVLFVEFAPEILKRFDREEWGEKIHRAMPLFAGMGVLLSTLHQSSLGTLYLIVPGKLHEFWYSPSLPVYFFLSAIQCGIGMVIVEASLSHYGMGTLYESRAMKMLGRLLIGMTAVTLLFRLADLGIRGVDLGMSSSERTLLLLEIGLAQILPLVVLAPGSTPNPARLFTGGVLAVAGTMLHRMNVAVTGMERAAGVLYVPTLTEITVTVSLAGLGIYAFIFLSRNVLEIEPEPGPRENLLNGFSGSVLGGVAVALVLVSMLPLEPGPRVLAEGAGGAVVVESDTWLPVYEGTVTIEGKNAAVFPHDAHTDSCLVCHGPALPFLKKSGRAFGHDDEGGCGECHDGERAFSIRERCQDCHKVEAPEIIDPVGRRNAAGPVRFTHRKHAGRDVNCGACHEKEFEKAKWSNLTMSMIRRGEGCGECHDQKQAFGAARCAACHETRAIEKKSYPKAKDSPGQVVFDHEQHARAAKGLCRECHESDQLKAPWPKVNMDIIVDGKTCGICHDGKKAFITDKCGRCHEGY